MSEIKGMPFEEKVKLLCAQALATDDSVEVGTILTELRHLLHRRIEQLRTGLIVAYAAPIIENTQPLESTAQVDSMGQSETGQDRADQSWHQLATNIAQETDPRKALQLSRELRRFLQRSILDHC